MESFRRQATLPPTSEQVYAFDDYEQPDGTEHVTVEIVSGVC